MSNITLAMLITSVGLQQSVSAVLRENDVVYTSPFEQDEDKYLLPYVQQNINNFSMLDAVIIDLGALKDTDEQVLEAIQAIRFFDDKIRIIILAGQRLDCFKVMNQCFLNGIYNLILPGSYVEIRARLSQAIVTGMSYKDALIFRDEEEFKKNRKAVLGMDEKGTTKTIYLYGVTGRMGVTHCTITAAYTLYKNGYVVAIVDCSGGQDYSCLIRERENIDDAVNDCFRVEGIDIYPVPVAGVRLKEKAYNYILFDKGENYIGKEAEEADEIILVCGSKPWEIECLWQNREAASKMKYLFNMTPTSALPELRKIMAGIDEQQIFIMDYLPELFSESKCIKEMLGIEEKGQKKRFFRRGK